MISTGATAIGAGEHAHSAPQGIGSIRFEKRCIMIARRDRHAPALCGSEQGTNGQQHQNARENLFHINLPKYYGSYGSTH
jgi:hypothetical protein